MQSFFSLNTLRYVHWASERPNNYFQRRISANSYFLNSSTLGVAWNGVDVKGRTSVNGNLKTVLYFPSPSKVAVRHHFELA